MHGGDLLAGDTRTPANVPLRNGRVLDFAQAPLLMGILNATPDSFYPGSRVIEPERAADQAVQMVADGADIIDIGGESTRPGSQYVTARTELERVLPVITAVRRRTDIPISIDTRKVDVARAALDAGADIVNDVSGLSDDPAIARLGAPVVLMHMKGTPATMQVDPSYDDVVREVCDELGRRVELALGLGVSKTALILDPGIGFGKRTQDNLALIKGIPKLRSIGYPILIGLSRKGFLGKIANARQIDERLPASIAANAYAMIAGADILRVHDIRETMDMKRILRAIVAAE